MSIIQFENFKRLKNLFRQLRSYGLNPRDWKLDRTFWKPSELSDEQLHMYHRLDRDFRFRAHVATNTAGQILLQDLNLISL